MARKATRGAQGNGSIRQRSNGMWEGRYTAGRDPRTGKQIQRSVYGKTQKEVAQKLRQVTFEIEEGTYSEPSRMTTGQWLDMWIEEYVNNVKEMTLNLYKSNINVRIKPGIGHFRLSELTTTHIQRFYNGLMKGDKPLTAKTVKNIHGVLHRALEQAVRLGFIKANPSDNVSLPRVQRAEIKPMADDDIALFLNALHGEPLEYLLITDLFTGMRRGEILGLTWDCVDFDRGTITISKQLIHLRDGSGEYRLTSPKNGKTRVIAPAQSIMDILQKQKSLQDSMRREAAGAWSNPEDFVFTNELGHHLYHSNVYRNFKRIVASIGMPETRFHDLRHSYAIAALQSGDDIKTLQENLGHHTAAFTLNVYGHVSDKMRQESARRMDLYFKNKSNQSKT